MKTRALRRYIAEKLKWKRRLNHGLEAHRRQWFFSAIDGFNHVHNRCRADIPPNPVYVKTPRSCSCSVCGNPRREGYDTTQEMKADESLRFDLAEIEAIPEWEDFEQDGYWMDRYIWNYNDEENCWIIAEYLQRGREPFKVPFLDVAKFR
jgi:hypothetical protein